MTARRKPEGLAARAVADELNAIKRLLVLELLTSGVQATAIAAALGVNKSSVSRLVPSRKINKRSARR